MTQDAGVADVFDSDLSEREIALVRSTYRVIARQGVRRLSLQNVADEAGVSKGLILYHFKTKDRLLLTTMRWALHRTETRIRDRLNGVEDPRETIGVLLDAVFIGPEQNRDFHLVYLDLVEHAARDASFSELSTLTEQVINGMYAEVIRDGVQRGTLDIDDVEAAAASMRSHIEGTFLTWLQRKDWKRSHKEYKERCREGVLRLLGVC
jgi:AcrR family transcriptional regulator